MSSLFNKNLPHSCSYCVHGKSSAFEKEIICKKHGITKTRDYCRHYKYDPLKRVPNKVKISGNFSPDDFSL